MEDRCDLQELQPTLVSCAKDHMTHLPHRALPASASQLVSRGALLHNFLSDRSRRKERKVETERDKV